MLTHLSIRNFRNHTKLELSLDPHVTVVSGKSGSGKTAVLAALEWLCLNRPSGVRFIRRGAKNCIVALIIDGHDVLRLRDKAANQYGIDGKMFKALGQGVPDEIARCLNVGPRNFQGQLDAPYWFLQSAGEVSRELNAIVNLGQIDLALAGAAAEVKRSKLAVELARERTRAAKEALSGLQWANDANKCLKRAEAAWEEVEGKAIQLDRAKKLAYQALKYERVLTSATRILTAAAVAYSTRLVLAEFKSRMKCAVGLFDALTDLQNRSAKAHTGADNKERQLAKLLERCPLCGRS